MINYCKNMKMYSKQHNFYDKFVIFLICDNESKHKLKDILIVKEINITRMLNTTRFIIKNYRKHH